MNQISKITGRKKWVDQVIRSGYIWTAGRENLNLENDWQKETTRIEWLCNNIAE
jgi:hypothetical protein